MIEHGGYRAAVTRFDPGSLDLVIRIARPFGENEVEYLRQLHRPLGASELEPVRALLHQDPLDIADIRIPEHIARILHELLLEHFGTPAQVQLRADYEYERGRRAMLEGVMCELAKRQR